MLQRTDGHDRYRLLAAGSIDGRIAPDEAVDLERHLAGCASCRAELVGLRSDHAWLAAPANVAAPRPEIRDVILAAARGPRVPRTSDAPRSFLPAFAGVAALLVVGVLTLNLVFAPPGPGAVPSATAEPSVAASVAPTPVRSGGAEAGCRAIPAGLSARWSFDDQVERFSGAPLTLVGDARGVEGISGSALGLAGPTSEALVADTGVAQLGSGDFTIAAWVRLVKRDGEQVLVERFRDGTPSAGWTITKLDSGELRLAIGTSDGSFSVDSVDARLTLDVWHHVAARRGGSTFAIFVDGRAVGTGVMPAGTMVDVAPELPLLFGRRGDPRGYHLTGDLDEVLIWAGRTLSEAELADVRKAGTVGFCEAAAGAGYDGTWGATDCAATGYALDCGRWGDESALRLTIGPGEEPSARFEDSSVEGCGADGGPGPRVGNGIGRFVGVYLWLTFTDISCTVPSESWQPTMQIYKGFTDRDIWVDPDGDGWGTIWRPA